MFSSMIGYKEIMLSIGSILVVTAFIFIIKKYMGKYKRPNGKRKGITSLNVALAFSIITVLALTTRDWFITSLVVILAYIIGRNKIDSGEYYMYQVIPFGIFYYYDKNILKNSGKVIAEEEEEDMRNYDEENSKEESREEDNDDDDLRLDEK